MGETTLIIHLETLKYIKIINIALEIWPPTVMFTSLTYFEESNELGGLILNNRTLSDM